MIDEWVRISWSLHETYNDYLKRSRVERLLLHECLSIQISRIYSDDEDEDGDEPTGGGPPGRDMRKLGL